MMSRVFGTGEKCSRPARAGSVGLILLAGRGPMARVVPLAGVVMRMGVVIATGLVLAALLAGCDHTGPPRENQPPTAEITTSPVEGDTLDYRLRAFWTGSDPDGYVDHYEYAVGPPTQIADDLPALDWVPTVAFNQEFAFSATLADSAIVGSNRRPTGRFHDMHAIYVRAVDDDGAVSPPDRVAFTAETVAPESEITRPVIEGEFLNIGSRVTVTWSGVDPDAGAGDERPVGYLYRLLDLRSLNPPQGILHPGPEVLFRKDGTDSLWTYQSADSLSHTFFPTVPGSYIFGVRAVDEAGAAEPFLELGRNAFKFMALASNGYPSVEVHEPSLGTYSFRGPRSPPYELEALTEVPLRFQVSCDASEYGGVCADMRWGLDIADLEADEGWSDWAPIGPLPEIRLDTGVHGFYVQVRDDEGAVSLAILVFEVWDAPLDRNVLWVDDSRDQTFPRDAEHDAFWADLFEDSGRFGTRPVDKYEMFGANDTYSRNPILPTLGQLAVYRLIVWENYGSGYNGDSGLWQVTTRNRHLGTYLRAGGQLWVGGALTMSAMLPAPGLGADFHYPLETLVPDGSFPCEFLKLCSSRIENAKGGVSPGTDRTDNMIGVRPFPGRAEVYPALEQDPDKVSPFKGAISHADAVFDPILLHGQPGFHGVLDSLYAYQAVNPQSDFQDKLCAVRWHDPDPARDQGRTQWFGFPLYYMQKEQAQETFNRSIDWFREEEAPQP